MDGGDGGGDVSSPSICVNVETPSERQNLLQSPRSLSPRHASSSSSSSVSPERARRLAVSSARASPPLRFFSDVKALEPQALPVRLDQGRAVGVLRACWCCGCVFCWGDVYGASAVFCVGATRRELPRGGKPAERERHDASQTNAQLTVDGQALVPQALGGIDWIWIAKVAAGRNVREERRKREARDAGTATPTQRRRPAPMLPNPHRLSHLGVWARAADLLLRFAVGRRRGRGRGLLAAHPGVCLL